MRIVLYGINYAPELTGIGKFSGELGAWLAARGHEVRVLAAPPYYPEWQLGEGYSGWAYGSEMREGVRVLRSPLWVPKSTRTLHRLIHLASFAVSSLPVALAQALWRPQVVLSVAPALFTAPTALALARLSGAKAVLHFQDFEIDAAFGLGMIQAGMAERLARRFERGLLRAFDRVSTISDTMRQALLRKGLPEADALLFPNWVDCEVIQPLVGPSPFRTELGISPETRVAMYSGAMGEKQGLELVVEAAQRLRECQDIVFVLAGSGAARDRLEPTTACLSNVRWLPLQPASRLNDWLNLADVHLLPQRHGAADMVMPSKLTGILASGRPVVTTADSGTQLHEVVGDRLGEVTPPENVDRFASAIRRMCEDAALRERLGRNARAYALAHYDKEAVLGRFEQALLTLVGLQQPAVLKEKANEP